jgi:hypothetical protein
MKITKLISSERGQALVFVAAALGLFTAMAAVAIDLGNFYWSYQELLGATQAAAKAGGGAMTNPNVSSATTVADQYSGDARVGGLYNIHSNLNMTGVNVAFGCVPVSTYPNLDMPDCINYPNACPAPGATCNAIQVTESATVQTFFAKLFGINTLSIAPVVATASAGGGGQPYHIVIVLDSTNSMGTGTDSDCSVSVSGSFSPEQCAQLGIQSLLSVLSPGTASYPIDQVALVTFPGLMPSETTTLTDPPAPAPKASDDTNCPATNPPITSYNNNPGYLIVGFPNAGDFSTYNYAGLNSNSPLVDSVGAGTIGGCTGIKTPGGEHTFYAGAIVAAQQYLEANHTSTVQDVIIFLSDGDASATGSASTTGSDLYGNVPVPTNVQSYFSAQSVKNLLVNGFYTSNAECQQAVYAADWAKSIVESDGTSTKIFGVSYGSESSGCTSGDTLTPCQTIQGIASPSTSTMQYFFSVEQSGGLVCSGAQSGVNKMDSAFAYIGGELTGSRLVPNSVYP